MRRQVFAEFCRSLDKTYFSEAGLHLSGDWFVQVLAGTHIIISQDGALRAVSDVK